MAVQARPETQLSRKARAQEWHRCLDTGWPSRSTGRQAAATLAPVLTPKLPAPYHSQGERDFHVTYQMPGKTEARVWQAGCLRLVMSLVGLVTRKPHLLLESAQVPQDLPGTPK